VILIFNALVLYISDLFAKGFGAKKTNARKGKDIADLKPQNALVIGLCQMIAVVPGLSRSGSTITGGLTQGLDREKAVKFSFIMSIPAIIGANILQIPDMIQTPVPQSDIFSYAVGMFTALIAGVAAIKLLTYISKKSDFRIFSYYCVIIGIITVIFG
jgi:undecaprenyl-diphosphatase